MDRSVHALLDAKFLALCPGEWALDVASIYHIHQLGSCGVTEIGEHLGVTSAAASQMLDRLVQQGLVHRTEDPDDRRVKQIGLTAEGQRILHAGIKARESWLDQLAEKLSSDEKDRITAALQVLVAKGNQLG